jgi:hypothetical protein
LLLPELGKKEINKEFPTFSLKCCLRSIVAGKIFVGCGTIQTGEGQTDQWNHAMIRELRPHGTASSASHPTQPSCDGHDLVIIIFSERTTTFEQQRILLNMRLQTCAQTLGLHCKQAYSLITLHQTIERWQ